MYRETPAEDMVYAFEVNCAWTQARELLQSRWGDSVQPSVLDVGCHTGVFLAGLPATWSRFGVESALEPIRQARESGIEIIAPRIEDVGVAWRGRFDAVCLFDVVEHLVDPAAGLAAASRLLRPGGVLIASTADLDAWTWKLARGRHWYLQSPQHLSIASKSFFRRIASDNGLHVQCISRIPHRRGSFSERMQDRLATLYWEMRVRGGLCRIPQRVLQVLPGLKRMRHRQTVPWSMRLADHMFVALAQPGGAEIPLH
jgi:SAM-dependent methyltransferase